MATYALIYSYVDDAAALDEARPRHREFLLRLGEQGICLAAGKFAPSEQPGGLLIFRHDDRDELTDILSRDPFQLEGMVTGAKLIEWTPAVGPVAPDLQ
ncbi:YciI family protein [Granulicoccus phenolivorans]|uniref:YciI family protein n=1 Tax=Granulicoccus phenolivorans TaxID=266854 RepID=UPI0004110EB8|nr:YciI family protein [Granulicoccus phenolivorans]